MVEMMKVQPFIDCQKQNLKQLREKGGVEINERIINVVLANAT